MMHEKLNDLRIAPEQKTRPKGSLFGILIIVLAITGAAIYFAIPRKSDSQRLFSGSGKVVSPPDSDGTAAPNSAMTAASRTPGAQASPSAATNSSGADSVLTVSGYIVAHERIEISPRFMGVVKWIGVKKGDVVTNNQVVVLLDDAEYRARLMETEGRLDAARANLEKARLQYQRVKALANASVESKQVEDDARLTVESAKAAVKELEGTLQWTRTYLDWCVIRSPIDGVVLEKLVDPDELVTPQSFGGTRGPSTALISLANLKDLQVEIDLNEADVGKVFLGQKCRVSPQAYPDKTYDGYVAEKAPEANRQKGTLQVKVQILNPDAYLTPELTAQVDFLNAAAQKK
jgi:HlyD family secretion protein